QRSCVFRAATLSRATAVPLYCFRRKRGAGGIWQRHGRCECQREQSTGSEMRTLLELFHPRRRRPGVSDSVRALQRSIKRDRRGAASQDGVDVGGHPERRANRPASLRMTDLCSLPPTHVILSVVRRSQSECRTKSKDPLFVRAKMNLLRNSHVEYKFWVYVVASRSGTLYIGVTNNIERGWQSIRPEPWKVSRASIIAIGLYITKLLMTFTKRLGERNSSRVGGAKRRSR